jgi:hypothetical protein
VLNRTILGEEYEDDDGRRALRSTPGRVPSMMYAHGGMGFHPYQTPGMRPMPYTSFSALPPQYAMYGFGGSISTKHMASLGGRSIPYRNYRPSTDEEEAILKKLEETTKVKALVPPKSPPKVHRGFGASAQRFNQDGSLDVGEFRSKWRCAWCLLSGKFTPTLRRGPMGSKVSVALHYIVYIF